MRLRLRAAGLVAFVAIATGCPSAAPRPQPAPEPAAARTGAARGGPAGGAPAPAQGGALVAGLSRLESDVLRETNRARQDPAAYAELLEEQLRHYDGLVLRVPGETAIRTEEGARAVREAIRVLRGLRPIAPLGHAPGLSRAARDHVRDQGGRGATGHTGTDGSSPSVRVSRHGTWDIALSENIAYGPATGRDVVVGLIVDDGVPDRGHRLTIFDPTLRVAGVACGAHRTYRMMCVINYAGSFTEGATTAAATRRD